MGKENLKKFTAILLSINLIGSSIFIPIGNSYGEEEENVEYKTGEEDYNDKNSLNIRKDNKEIIINEEDEKKLEETFNIKNYSEEKDIIKLSSWNEVQEKIDSGESLIDISNLENDALGKIINISGRNVNIISNSEKIFKNLQFRISNDGRLIINNLNLDNSNKDTTISPIYIEDKSNNIIELENENTLIPNKLGSGIAVNNKKLHNEEVDTNLSLLGEGSLYIKSGILNEVSGAGIGGEYERASGNIFIGENVNIEIKALGLGAGIGGGTEQKDYSNGNITISDNSNVKIIGDKATKRKNTSAGIGSGISFSGNSTYSGYSGKITIEKNSEVFIEKYGDNFSGIGTTNKMGNLDDIIIKDNTNLIIGINDNYNPKKYGDKNFGFEDLKDNVGNNISAIGTAGNSMERLPSKINIEGSPSIKIGSSSTGIHLGRGKINIGRENKGDNIKLEIFSLFGGIKTGEFNLNESEINIFNTTGDIRSANYYDENGKKRGLGKGSAIESTNIINIADSNLILDSYDGAAIGAISSHGATSISEDTPSYRGELNINIKRSTIKGESYMGAGIGGYRQKPSRGIINLEDNELIDMYSTHGSAIGTAVYGNYKKEYNDKLIINLKNNKKIIARSDYGAGIGNGQGAKNNFDVNIINNDNTDKNNDNKYIEASSYYGAGIGAGGYASVNASRYISVSGDIKISGGEVLARSITGSGIGGGGYNFFNITTDNKEEAIEFYDDKNRTEENEGRLLITNNAIVHGFSRGTDIIEDKIDKEKNIRIDLRGAISAKLLEGSDEIIGSNVLSESIDRYNHYNLNVYNDRDELVKNLKFQSEFGNSRQIGKSYAYTLNIKDKESESYKQSEYYTETLSYEGKKEDGKTEELVIPIEFSQNLIRPNRHVDNIRKLRSITKSEEGVLKDITTQGHFASINFNSNGGKFIDNEDSYDLDPEKNYIYRIERLDYDKDPEIIIKTPVKLGSVFKGWDESKDAKTPKYTNDTLNYKNIPFNSPIILYAVWDKVYDLETQDREYIICDEFNIDDIVVKLINNIDEENIKDIVIEYPGIINKENITNKSGKYKIILKFKDIEKEVNIKVNPKKYEVKFESNGGSEVKSEILSQTDINTSVKANHPNDPTKTGYIFKGWHTDEELTELYKFDKSVTKDITLYAKWEKKEIPIEPETRLSDTVVLASGYKYTDVLTATVLANEKHAPILLSEVDSLTDDTITEIKRINPKEIIISGGENSVSKKVENLLKSELKDIRITRVAGKDRYETAKNIGVKVREISPNKAQAMLVDGTNFPDVITMSTIASERRAPILLTEPSILNETTKNSLNEFNIKDIIIGGGINSVSVNIENSLKVDKTVNRYGGSDRYETASIVGNAYRTLAGVSNNLIIVDGTNFPDGITTSSLASKIKAPILLTKPNSLPEITADDINTWKATNTIIAGGENSVSANIFNQVNGSERISGKDRYETAVKISQKYLNK